MSKAKEKRFREPLSSEPAMNVRIKAVSKSTMYKNQWGVNIFKAWQCERENKSAMCESNPFCLDLTGIEDLDTSQQNYNLRDKANYDHQPHQKQVTISPIMQSPIPLMSLSLSPT